jgi:hypothetical protein
VKISVDRVGFLKKYKISQLVYLKVQLMGQKKVYQGGGGQASVENSTNFIYTSVWYCHSNMCRHIGIKGRYFFLANKEI